MLSKDGRATGPEGPLLPKPMCWDRRCCDLSLDTPEELSDCSEIHSCILRGVEAGNLLVLDILTLVSAEAMGSPGLFPTVASGNQDRQCMLVLATRPRTPLIPYRLPLGRLHSQ